MKLRLLILMLFWFSAAGAQQKWEIKFYSETQNHEYSIFADNDEYMPMAAKINFKLKNLTSTLADSEVIVIPPRTKRFPVAVLRPITPHAANSVSYTTTFNFGDVTQESFEADYIYDLPFESGKTYLVYQGYNGKFSHQNEFALDLDLKTGDKILAAREGTVVTMVDSNTRNCADISCAKFNNKVLILHSDGTFAEYSHLKYRGAEVKKGDVVTKGQLLGFSGNTGFSSGPHLHFAVFINRLSGKRTFVKTRFKTAAAEPEFLVEGKKYLKNY